MTGSAAVIRGKRQAVGESARVDFAQLPQWSPRNGEEDGEMGIRDIVEEHVSLKSPVLDIPSWMWTVQINLRARAAAGGEELQRYFRIYISADS
jgi:hypothetical protein